MPFYEKHNKTFCGQYVRTGMGLIFKDNPIQADHYTFFMPKQMKSMKNIKI